MDLSAEKEIEKDKTKNKSSLKGLLTKTKREEEKLTKLEEVDAAAASKIKEKKMWKSILERSEGNKVRDDPKLIEKTLNKKKKLKLKRKKAWDEHIEKQEKQKQFRQEKRQRNIDDRKRKRKEKKLKQAKKRRNF